MKTKLQFLPFNSRKTNFDRMENGFFFKKPFNQPCSPFSSIRHANEVMPASPNGHLPMKGLFNWPMRDNKHPRGN